jgi:hypothetical protein
MALAMQRGNQFDARSMLTPEQRDAALAINRDGAPKKRKQWLGWGEKKAQEKKSRRRK